MLLRWAQDHCSAGDSSAASSSASLWSSAARSAAFRAERMRCSLATWVSTARSISASLGSVSCTSQLLGTAGLCNGARQGWLLWCRGIARLPSVAVSSLGLLSPVTAVLLGWVLLGQAMTGVSLVGMLVVLASILAVQWAMSRAVMPAVR